MSQLESRVFALVWQQYQTCTIPTFMMKTCRSCGNKKPLDHFPKRKVSKDGRRNECKACRATVEKSYYPKYRARNRAGHLRRKFGMTAEAYAQLCSQQHNLYANGVISETYPITKGHDPVEGKVEDQGHFQKSGRVRDQWLNHKKTYLPVI